MIAKILTSHSRLKIYINIAKFTHSSFSTSVNFDLPKITENYVIRWKRELDARETFLKCHLYSIL